MEKRNGCLFVAFVAVVFILGATVATSSGAAASAVGTGGAPLADGSSPTSGTRYTAEINPVIELLAGVQAQTDWIKMPGPGLEGTEYFRALKAFFEPYKDHPAIKISAKLLASGFAFDAPVGFACHLGPLPDLALEHEYSDYLIGRAGGREILEDFRLALKDLAEESNFAEFVEQWQPYYDTWVAGAAFDGDKVINWLNDFSGTTASEYHMILAPSLYPGGGGGYGATVTTADGRQIIYQIIRASAQPGDTQPVLPNGRSLESLALHEWGHSFVNPAVQSYPDGYAVMSRYYPEVSAIMQRQAYGDVHTYACEQFLRAVTTLAADEMYGANAAESEIQYQESRGFKLTRPIYETLKSYRASRDKYPTFAVYVPEIYRQIGGEPAKQTPATMLLEVLIGVFLVAAAVAVVVRERRAASRPAE